VSKIGRRQFLLSAAAVTIAAPFIGRARAAQPVRIGVLADMNGPYATLSGDSAVTAAKLAVEDFRRDHPDLPVEIVFADFQLKPDAGLAISRGWFDTGGVDCIIDVPMSALALGLTTLVREKNKVALFTGTATEDLTGPYCTPNHLHWTYDSYSQAATVAHALLKEGRKTWFFIAADYAMGASVVRDASKIVAAGGGKVLGTVAHPFPGPGDFSSYLLQAQASGASVVCFANAGDDLASCVKQAAEFGIGKGETVLAAMLMDVPTVHAIGLGSAQGMYYSNAFYWDRDDATRAFSKRIGAVVKNNRPAQNIAGAYSGTLHYLKAVHALGLEKAKVDGRAVIAEMKAMATDDPLFGKGSIRPNGRVIHPAYLLRVKSPEASRYPWDYATIVQEVPGDEAFRPLAESACPMKS
jgi:branched-chain amino acid transport system substrate-binding protein